MKTQIQIKKGSEVEIFLYLDKINNENTQAETSTGEIIGKEVW